MSRRTEKYRELLEKQRKQFQETFDRLFLSFEMILDNVDQEYDHRKLSKTKRLEIENTEKP